MPILTRVKKVKEKELETSNTMIERKENRFYNYQDIEIEDTSEKLIQEAQQDPKFQKFMEKFLENDKDKYLLMLNSHGAKLSDDFNTKK